MDRNYVIHGCLPMRRGSVLRVEDGSDIVITVLEGELWLTQERDRRDRYLAAGQSFRLDRQGIAIGYAMRRAVLSMSAPSPRLYARRIALARGGTTVELYSAAKGKGSLGAWLRRIWSGLFAPHARPTTASL